MCAWSMVLMRIVAFGRAVDGWETNKGDCVLGALHARLKDTRGQGKVDVVVTTPSTGAVQMFALLDKGASTYTSIANAHVSNRFSFKKLFSKPKRNQDHASSLFPHFYSHKLKLGADSPGDALLIAIDTDVFDSSGDALREKYDVQPDDLESRLALMDSACTWITRSIKTEGPGCSNVFIFGHQPIVCTSGITASVNGQQVRHIDHQKELLGAVNRGMDALTWHGGANATYVCTSAPGFQASVIGQDYMGHSRSPIAHIATGTGGSANVTDVSATDGLSVHFEAVDSTFGYCEITVRRDGSVECANHKACQLDSKVQLVKFHAP